jgi:hypothetical protein
MIGKNNGITAKLKRMKKFEGKTSFINNKLMVRQCAQLFSLYC